uniref:Uncharacterized protein n=1 Tax=Syphacia muris TaxID=451379 RepID=A0A0N5AYH0_9BILA
MNSKPAPATHTSSVAVIGRSILAVSIDDDDGRQLIAATAVQCVYAYVYMRLFVGRLLSLLLVLSSS